MMLPAVSVVFAVLLRSPIDYLYALSGCFTVCSGWPSWYLFVILKWLTLFLPFYKCCLLPAFSCVMRDVVLIYCCNHERCEHSCDLSSCFMKSVRYWSASSEPVACCNESFGGHVAVILLCEASSSTRYNGN